MNKENEFNLDEDFMGVEISEKVHEELVEKSKKEMIEEKQTEKRMYCLVAYNLSDIQKGIQLAHSVVELNKLPYNNFKYKDWADNHKTIIVLNGGTSNNNKESKWYGTLQQHRDRLVELGVTIGEFYEPDYNDGLTAIVFIVDMEKDWIILKYLENLKLA